jgi:GNAT superfamily N-acetyltransferase
MSDSLRALDFTPELLDPVQDFDCGDAAYRRELADWIRNDAVPAMEQGTKVWLYINEANEIVGYGSLGVTRWKYPDAQSTRVELVLIPAVALRKEFWGKPEGVERDERYSSQILRHLIDEAQDWPGEMPAVGLFVHPDNVAAIKLYERFQFRPFHRSYTDPASQVTYISFLRPLQRG